ncbi:MAG TPA: hypothetical protein DDZ89_14305 [Clostridiales bacterium]|nr:hypothetical protein [Clostridiales bacterium]
MINNPPDNLENGNIVCVDELNQYCGSVTHEEHENISYSGKNLNSKENTKKKEKSDRQEKIEIKGKALVLGNNAYANSYRLSLLKCGYYANVLEGYEPWAKIKTMMRGVDIIVVVTSHISHENMQRIKKEVNDIPVIYSEFDGANRVQTQILVKLRESSLTGNA